ncbi:MAG: hypothetical protein EXR49_06015 [Dehalococcoidia bacterium]|nr:hypothetical protein [Dehalococcoidia bacterium]
MTKLLEKAFKQAGQLPESEQNAVAAWLLEELASEGRWQSLFTATQRELAAAAAKAKAESRRGRTRELDPAAL